MENKMASRNMKTEGKTPGNTFGGTPLRDFLNRPLSFWLRLGLGGVFILAGVEKILNPGAFAEIVHNYRVLPDGLVNLAAIILPWFEVCLGVLLLLGFWLPGAVLFTNLLLLIFFGTLVFNTARGINVHCGCFSTSTASGVPSPAWYIVRDAVFLLLGGTLFFLVFPKKRSAVPPVEETGEGLGNKSGSL